MQSSGASLFTLLLGQIPDSLVVVDLWALSIAPALRYGRPVILKATIGSVPLEAHLASFEPDHTVLFIRHPVDQIASLETKSYRDYAGSIEAKLEKMDCLYAARDRFDTVTSYEELTGHPRQLIASLRSVGIDVPSGAERFERSPETIIAHAKDNSPWCREEWRRSWGTGRADIERLHPLRPATVERTERAWALARTHCPRLLAHYEWPGA